MMKKIRFGIFLSACLVVVAALSFRNNDLQAANPPGIKWTPVATALTKAKEENKPILLDFYADWCGPCKMMDKQTYTDPTVQKEMANWITVRVDVDHQQALAAKHDIKAIPTTVLLDPSGKAIGRETGFIDAKQYLALLEKSRPKK
jgi:thiol:disulfide interchange protein